RTGLVWKRPEISDAEFRRLWLGEHVARAKQLRRLREYLINFVTQGPAEGPAGIATLRFDSRQALDAAFNDPGDQRPFASHPVSNLRAPYSSCTSRKRPLFRWLRGMSDERPRFPKS